MYLEFYEYFTDRVLAGVPDYIPAETTDGAVTVMPAAFGELDEGILNVSKVKTGELRSAVYLPSATAMLCTWYAASEKHRENGRRQAGHSPRRSCPDSK